MTTQYGTKYEAGRDIADIAKLIRADIKAAIKTGALPTMTTKVCIRRYAGGQSLDVTVTECETLKNNPVDPERAHWPDHVTDRESVALRNARATLEEIMRAYNYDGSDSSTDYFSVNFYGHVTFADSVFKAA